MPVVALAPDVGDLEVEVRMPRRDLAPAPVHGGGNDVEALVAAGEPVLEGVRHPPAATADVEHVVVRLEAPELDEVPAELVAHGQVVAAAHQQLQPPGRQARVAAAAEPADEVGGATSKVGKRFGPEERLCPQAHPAAVLVWNLR